VSGGAGGWRIVCALITALAIAAFAFAFRFNSMSGSLGGFDDDHFATLMRVDLLLEGQQPLRDFIDFELRGAWPSLSYVVPAWAQEIGGRSLLPEAYLTVGLLALGHAAVFLVALGFSGRWSVALLAAGFAIATTPKLYNYPKVLMLLLGVIAIRAVALSPSWPRLLLAAAVTAASVLFRHDYGVYVAAGLVPALVAYGGGWRSIATRVGTYAGLTTVLLLPSAAWVQTYEGIPSYVRKIAESATLEAQRTELRLPGIGDALVLLIYYAFWLVAVAAGVALIARLRASSVRLSSADRATAVGLLAMVIVVNLLFLRANLTQRFGDAVVPVALLAAWAVGAVAAVPSAMFRKTSAGAVTVLLAVLFGATVATSDSWHRLAESGMTEGWSAATTRFADVRDRLRALPPVEWSHAEANGSLPAARYVAQCTAPSDHLLVAGYAPEIHVMARRRFAAGQGTMSLGFYTAAEDQQRALERWTKQSVPIVLAEAEDFQEGFASDYPILAAHLRDRYREAGSIALEGDARILVFVEVSRTPTGTDPHLGLPCFS
jgi:hypothetical protein